MAHTYTHLLVHVVLCTKERRPLLDEELKERLVPYLAGIAERLGAQLLAANGPADHIHLLMLFRPAVALADLVRSMKGSSSKWIHDTWPSSRATFAWQQGYAAFTVSQSARERVEKYIGAQQEHHRRASFQQELRSLLERHGVPFDERYLLG